jgi:hypothetical protein
MLRRVRKQRTGVAVVKSVRVMVLVLLPVLCLAACSGNRSSSSSDEDAVHGMALTGKNM